MRLTGVMIGTEDSKKLSDFYKKFLGKPVWEETDWFGWDISGGWLGIGPHSEVKGKSAEPARIMISIESQDVKADFEKIKGCGAEVIAEPYHPGKDNDKFWLATLADPDGNYIQISTPWDQ